MADKKVAGKKEYTYAVGRRKAAVATVKLYRGKNGNTTVNGINIVDYFPGLVAEHYFQKPFKVTNTTGKFFAKIVVRGGGKKGQLEAVTLAFSRALNELDREKYRPFLKKEGLLTVDSRVRERRKVGQMGRARKKKQSPKR
ncbi:MAG: 30S ribosomal protein S9 [Patescibacteria group bacterium]|nr:30S ribosomal protein S9 [Patescibacteria group bacterium]